MQIKFQTALITGSSRGLGRQIAAKLATEGVKKIAIHYRTGESDAAKTLSLIEAAGASGVLVQGDVADAVAAENLVKDAAGEGGDGRYQPIFCGGAGAIWDYGEYSESRIFGCVDGSRTNSARVASCDVGMGAVGMDSYAPTVHTRRYCGCLCAAV